MATVPFVYRYYPSVREARARIAAGDAGALRLLHGSYLQDWHAGPCSHELARSTRPSAAPPARSPNRRALVRPDGICHRASDYQAGGPHDRLRAAPPKTAPPCCSDTDAAHPAAWWSAKSHRGARTGCGSPWTASTRPTPSTRKPPSTSGSAATQNLILPRGADAQSEQAQRYSVLPPGHPQGYQDCFNAFVADTYAAVRGDRRDGLPTFVDGLRAAAISDAVIRSAATENWEEIAA